MNYLFGIFLLVSFLLLSCAKTKISETQPSDNSESLTDNVLVLVNNNQDDQRVIIGGYDYGIKKLNNIEQITVSIEEGRNIDFTGIENLKNLKNLDIYLREKFDIDFSPLKSLNKLESVLLSGPITELPDFSGIPSLSYFRIFHSKLKSLNGIEKITQLESLIILESREPLTDISALRHLKKLKRLWFRYGSYNIDFSVLGDLPELEELFIDCGKVDLSGIRRLKSLNKLSLISNALMETDERYVYKNIEEIGALTNLEILYIDETITSIEFLAGNTNLEELTLIADKEREDYWENNLPLDVAPLGNLKKLKCLVLRGFDLENVDVIDKLPQLEHFDKDLYELE